MSDAAAMPSSGFTHRMTVRVVYKEGRYMIGMPPGNLNRIIYVIEHH